MFETTNLVLLFIVFSLYFCVNSQNINFNNSEKVNKTKLPENYTIETSSIEVFANGFDKPVINRTITTSDVNGTQTIYETDGNSTEIIKQPGKNVMSYLTSLYKSQAIGENCTTQSACTIRESICLNGICQCQDSYVAALDKRHCLKVARSLGDDCVQDAQCFTGLNVKEGYALCTSFRCVCGTYTMIQNGTCVRLVNIGDTCDSNKDCTAINSTCIQGACTCPKGMMPNYDSKSCIPVLRTINSTCNEDEQCQEAMGDFTICSNGYCVCKPNSHFNSKECVPDLQIGEICASDPDCQISQESAIDKRTCMNNKCACATGFIEVVGNNICRSSSNNINNNFMFIFTSLLLILLNICS